MESPILNGTINFFLGSIQVDECHGIQVEIIFIGFDTLGESLLEIFFGINQIALFDPIHGGRARQLFPLGVQLRQGGRRALFGLGARRIFVVPRLPKRRKGRQDTDDQQESIAFQSVHAQNPA